MNSVSLVQSNVDSLPPPIADVPILPEPPDQISSPVLPPPHPLQKELITKRLVASLARPSATETETWLEDALHLRWKSYRERLNDCRNHPTAESVHELRVAIRRLISQLALVNEAFPARRSEKVRKILKRQLESLGDLRDTHVQQIFFRR